MMQIKHYKSTLIALNFICFFFNLVAKFAVAQCLGGQFAEG